MSVELVQHFSLGVVIGLIVLGVGIAIAMGMSPGKLMRLLEAQFEPTQTFADNPAGQFSIACENSIYIVKLKDANIVYKSSLNSDDIRIVILLDLRNNLYKGEEAGDLKIITCNKDENTEFLCKANMEFIINNLGSLNPKENLHFTLWRYAPEMDTVIQNNPTSFYKLFDEVPQRYLSSFDIVVEPQRECKKSLCESKTAEADCRGEDGCYWSGSCNICGTTNICKDYSKEACDQCPLSRDACRPGLLWGCEVE